MLSSELVLLFNQALDAENDTPEQYEAAVLKAFEAISKVKGLEEFQERYDYPSWYLLEWLKGSYLYFENDEWKLRDDAPDLDALQKSVSTEMVY